MPEAVASREHAAAASMAPAHGLHVVPLPKRSEQHRFHLLDAARGVAAALVVIFHAPLDHILYPESFLAVDLFFCLSGFVVCASYEQKLATKMSIKTFTLTRFIRLYPVHLLGILVMVSGLYVEHLHHPNYQLHATPVTIILGILLLPVFSSRFNTTFPLNGPSWSLFFEIIANIFYALLLRLRIAKTIFLAAICIVSFGLLSYLTRSTAKDFDVGWAAGTFFQGFLRVGYSFFAGVLLFRVYRSGFRLHLSRRLSSFVSILVILLVIACLTHPVLPGMKWTYDAWMIGIVFPALVFVGACCKVSGYWITICSFFGDFSYPLYILHVPIMFALSFVIAHLRIVNHPEVIAFGMVAVLTPISWWIGKYLDAPTRRYLAARL